MKLSNATEVLFDSPRTAPFSIRFRLEATRRIEEEAARGTPGGHQLHPGGGTGTGCCGGVGPT
jgi:hypothetical protein